MVDLNPSDHVRLEVAFESMPDDTDPAWVDLTSRLDLSAGISRTYGAQDEFSQPQPATVSVSVDNRDGALTPGNASSAFYPNVRPQRPLCLSYRDPAVSGNLLTAENASFEGGTVGGWTGSSGAVLANDTAHADVGTKALRITWPTGGIPWAQLLFTGLTIGRTYTAQARVWSATGVPNIRIGIFGITNGTATAVKDAFDTVSITFTATNTQHLILISAATATTAGQQTWVDAVLVDEGSSVRTFTTSAPPIEYLFTGHVEEWPTEWPGGQLYSQTVLTATDRLARIGSRRAMRSVIEEAVLADSPEAYYPLGEPEESTLAGDAAGRGAGSLSIATSGAGAGSLTFGTATGPPTDGLPAPTFTPASLTNGRYLTSTIPLVGIGFPVGVSAAFLTSSATAQVVAQVRDDYGSTLGLNIETGTGRLVAALYVPWFASSSFTITSTASVADGSTHYAEVLLDTSTAYLWLDGALVGTTALSGYPSFKYLDVGGQRLGSLFTGTISHVAVFGSSQTLAMHQVRNTAMTTGFAGERSDQRIARYAAWAGVPLPVRTNLIENPSFEVDTTGWSSVRGTLARTLAADSPSGSYACRYTSTDGTTAIGNQTLSEFVPVSTGVTYTASAYLKAQVTASTYGIYLFWYDAASAFLSQASFVTAGNLSGSVYTRLSVTGMAPTSATQARIMVTPQLAMPVASGYLLDAAMIEESDTLDSYIGTTTPINLDVGSSTSIAFTDTTGQSILSAMQDVAQTEGGRLFVNGEGDLVFHARSRRYANPASVASVEAQMLSGSERFTLSTQGMVNDLTGQRPDGPQIRAFDEDSIDEFGTFNQSATFLVTTDNEVADAINWRVSTSSEPEVRLPQGTFDLYTDATAAEDLRPVDLGDRLTITGLPSQAPASSMDFVLEGYSESISVSGWSRTANLTNYADVQGLTLDDDVYGLLDGDNRLVY